MRKKAFFHWLFVGVMVGLASACQPEAAPSGTSEVAAGEEKDDPAAAVNEFDQQNLVTLGIGGVRLRRSPGPEGEVLTTLDEGAEIRTTEEVSTFTTRIKLRGRQFEEPWWRVQTTEGKDGWIYGGLLHFSNIDQDLLTRKRLEALFGEKRLQRLENYRKAFGDIRTAKGFAACYRQGIALREDLVAQLDKHLGQRQEATLPNLFWLGDMLPGFLPQLVAEGTSYYLFADFRAWKKRSRATPEVEDDGFVDLQLSAYPEDSIEYFFPAWTIQMTDYGGHSLLGRNIHRQLLNKVDSLLQGSDLFLPELNRLKNDLINDITRPHVTYWEDQQAIVAEIQAILDADLKCLNRNDRIALQARLEQFTEPATHGIQLNHKSGGPI